MTAPTLITPFTGFAEFRAQLAAEHVLVREPGEQTLPPAAIWEVDIEDWGQLAQQARRQDWRWAAVWAEQVGDELLFSCCLEKHGGYLVARTSAPLAAPVLSSHTPYYAAADRPERHIQDLFGVAFLDHPDARRWARHKAWELGAYPLRKDYPKEQVPPGETPPDADYPFLQAQGTGVYEIPVGPVHAGIIEPGHFRFQAVGEIVLNLEERLGYVHKGIEKAAEGRDAMGLARLAGRVSGDTTVGHAWAACMAMERAAGAEVPPRASFLRALLAERERVANHLWDIAAICNDVGFAFAYYQFGRLRELWLRDNQRLFGHRLLMDQVVPGGVRGDLNSEGARYLAEQGEWLHRELLRLLPIIEENPSLEDRLVGTGVLSSELARRLGALGYVGRASGQGFDVRRSAPYAPYDRINFDVPVLETGDVAARLKVRALETLESLDLLYQILLGLPAGPVDAPWLAPGAGAEGMGMVEGWRGEILTYVRFGDDGRVSRYFPRDPSWLTWPALEKLIRENIVPDFPVCNKSVNGSYSGHDL